MKLLLLRYSFGILSVACFFLAACEKQASSAASSSANGAGGSLAKFAIIGNYLYTVDPHSLYVYDISNPAAPVSKGQFNAGFDIETIFPYNDKLFLGASNGLYIFNVSDPLRPVKESSITHFRACDPVVTNDSVSYVTLRSGSSCGSLKNVLNVYNVKDIKNPALVKEVDIPSPYGLGISRTALYVCQGDSGLAVFDLGKDPYNPKKVISIKDALYYDVIPYGDILIAFIDSGVCFFDIRDPLNIVKAGVVKN